MLNDKIKNAAIKKTGQNWATLEKLNEKTGSAIRRCCHNGLLTDILEAESGKQRDVIIGRAPLDYTSQITENVDCTKYREMTRVAENRETWRAVSNK